jgi:glycosyl transferase family 1
MIVADLASAPGTRRRRVLFITPDWPWPSTTGGRARARAIIDALRSSADVTVLAAEDPDALAPTTWGAACRRFAQRHASTPARLADIALGLLSGRHVALQRAIASGMPAVFWEIVARERPDLVILSRGFGGPFVSIAKRAGATVVLEADESLVAYNRSILTSTASRQARLRAAVDLMAVGRMERHDFSLSDGVWLGNDDEVPSLAAVYPFANLRVVPSVAPAVAYVPPGPVNAVGLVAFFRHPPNEEAALFLADSVMPILRARGGPQELRLIGRDPTKPLVERAADNAWITVTGEVADPVSELRAAGVLAMPITSGGGTRIKAIEAAAAGVPIVSTHFGVSGLGLEPGRDYLRAELPTEFADAIATLAADPDLRARMTESARASIEEAHSAEALRRIIREVLEDLPARA